MLEGARVAEREMETAGAERPVVLAGLTEVPPREMRPACLQRLAGIFVAPRNPAVRGFAIDFHARAVEGPSDKRRKKKLPSSQLWPS